MSWLKIVRLGLVQAALGSIVVLITSTLNRVMVVEYSLPAVLPGALVALHYCVQLMRPRFGYGSDRGGRCTPWILGGMGALSIGGVLCAVAAVGISQHPIPALALAIAAYSLVGMGVSAAGTSLLVLLAKRVGDRRRAAAATLMWILMIAGFAMTSGIAGHFLDPFSPRRLILVVGVAAAVAFAIAFAAVWGLERGVGPSAATREPPRSTSFGRGLRQVWAEPQARLFTLFVFTSMLAYSAQELLLEPFAGKVFGYTLGESSRLSGLWHAAVLIGLVSVGIACSGPRRCGTLRTWMIGGCIASAFALLGLACADLAGPRWPLRLSVGALGLANGVFAVAAIGSMMELAHRGEANSAGLRMGLWGAAQAVAFALGGIIGTFIVDLSRHLFGSSVAAFAIVFGIEALLFLVAANFAAQIGALRKHEQRPNVRAVAA
jgi:BCD family chlorophyll transporter-like MFS transporter